MLPYLLVFNGYFIFSDAFIWLPSLYTLGTRVWTLTKESPYAMLPKCSTHLKLPYVLVTLFLLKTL